MYLCVRGYYERKLRSLDGDCYLRETVFLFRQWRIILENRPHLLRIPSTLLSLARSIRRKFI